jgi:exodeoxyribonuclease VII small subunit
MAKKEEKLTYEQAVTRLEEIVRYLDNGDAEIDTLAEYIKEANKLITFCQAKLTKADKEIEKLLTDERESEE